MKTRWTTKDGECLPLTAEKMAQMRPLKDLDPEFLRRFEAEKRKRTRGRPAGRSKAVVSVSLDADIVDFLRKTGQGWQTRVNDLLRAAIRIEPHH